jgi:hypothetical protein
MSEKGTEALGGKAAPKAKPDAKKTEKKKPAKKSPSEMHVKQLHDGSYHVRHTHADKNGMPEPHEPEYSAANLQDLQDHMADHFGAGGEPDADDQPTAAQPAAAPPQA